VDRTSDDLLKAPKNGLLWESWDEGSSVFCPDTGETHHLSILPAEVLKQICAGPLTLGDLASSLAVACESENDRDWRGKIASIVSELRRLELVRTRV
jgi:hypothetical protein